MSVVCLADLNRVSQVTYSVSLFVSSLFLLLTFHSYSVINVRFAMQILERDLTLCCFQQKVNIKCHVIYFILFSFFHNIFTKVSTTKLFNVCYVFMVCRTFLMEQNNLQQISTIFCYNISGYQWIFVMLFTYSNSII